MMLDPRLELVRGNIVEMDVDAIVNAANNSLLGGGGVDGVIHRMAGPGLKEECRAFDGCPTGEVRLTGGHNLKATHVIHAVGPVWKGGSNQEESLLEQVYVNIITCANENGLARIAIPAISTGAYSFPLERATEIAVTAVNREIASRSRISTVYFCCFDRKALKAYQKFFPK